jgi:heptosyltransferase-2
VERLVIVGPNWLGDAVMALPAIADVRRGRPDASLTVAARASIAPLFSLVPGIDDVVVIPPRGAAPLSGHDVAVLLPNSFHSALTAARAGVRERWGYRTDWRGVLLTRAIDRPPATLHQIDAYQRLVASLGFANGPSVPHLTLPDGVRELGRQSLAAAGWDGRSPLAAIAPGAAYGSAKRWPPTAFADLVAGLAQDGVTTVILGAAADRPTAHDVRRALDGRATPIDLVDRTDLPGLAGVLVHCRALVANDSGAMHLAAALGVNVAAIFGPTDERLTAPRATSREPRATSPERGAPSPEPRATIVINRTWCRPCGLRECPLDHACMRGVRAQDVLVATRPLLASAAS